MANPFRPFSFRYPFEVAPTLEPWRDTLGDQFDAVVARLADRDRALEDYVNLGVSQGYLGLGVVPNGGQALTASYADISGATVTFTVPANRRVKTTVYCNVINLDGVGTDSFLKIIDENGTVVIGDSYKHAGSGSVGDNTMYSTTVFTTPAVGTHTYKLQGKCNNALCTLTSNVPANASGGSAFLSVEDVGPVSQ